MEKTIRVKIIDTKYYQDKDLVIWEMRKLETGEVIKIAFKGQDIGQSFGINQKVSPDIIEKFCNDMKNKEINWVNEVTYEDLPPAKDITDDHMYNLGMELSKYPFKEVSELDT